MLAMLITVLKYYMRKDYDHIYQMYIVVFN